MILNLVSLMTTSFSSVDIGNKCSTEGSGGGLGSMQNISD